MSSRSPTAKLDELLNNPVKRQAFRMHLASEWATESLEFVESVERLKHVPKDKVESNVLGIFNKYLSEKVLFFLVPDLCI